MKIGRSQMLFVVIVPFFCQALAVEIAREVEGGVELLELGPIELIMPETLSFSLKSPGKCPGELNICYAAKATTKGKLQDYHNYFHTCAPDKCILAIFNEFSGQAVTPQRRGDLIYYQFYDTAHSWCPRDVVNGRQKFVINELPKCPVIVNDASLPKHQEASSTPRTKWVIVICVVLLVLFLASVILGICIYMYFKKDHVLAVKPVPQRSKSPNTRTSHRKTSPALSPMNL